MPKDAKSYFRAYFQIYNYEHRHSGIAMLTPASVHNGDANTILRARHGAMLVADSSKPERFVNGQPACRTLPGEVWINRPSPMKLQRSHS